MRASLYAKFYVRRALWLAPACFIILAGCDSGGYPEDLTYPVRKDPLVVGLPTATVARPDALGPEGYQQFMTRVGEPEDKGGVGGNKLDPAKLKDDQRDKIEAGLQTLFGTPAEPKVNFASKNVEIETSDQESLQELKLDSKRLASGSKLYRRHCLHCHGVSGDGRGPTATWVNPHPRDYRQGIFKFTSSVGGNSRKPRREDLLRVLRNGIEGTAMPPFGLLPDQELEDLVSYVIHLSLRGQVEFDLMKTMLESQLDESIAAELGMRLKAYALNDWLKSENSPIKPGNYSETRDKSAKATSIEEGYKLFVQPGAASCIACHKDFGRIVDWKFEAWGTVGRPLDLTRGTYRGGRRPVDIYYRIHQGINGSAMPRFADSLKDEQIWQLVDFVQALPYKNMLPDGIREQVYPPTVEKTDEVVTVR